MSREVANDRHPSERKGPPPERFQSVRRPLILGDRNERADRLFSLVLAMILLPLLLPLILLVGLVVMVTSGFPLLHRGLRLGRSRKPFVMYKFRTLQEHAAAEKGAALMKASDRMTTPVGHFLRRTRLDELPQIFNVLRGDMDFVGPRPVRPAVYETFCRHIPDYDRRFAVRPGLIGQSQLFTPHGTPKRMRSLIDNSFLRRRHAWLGDVAIVWLAFYYLTRGLVLRLGRAIGRSFALVFLRGRVTDRREMDRSRPDETTVNWLDGAGQPVNAPLIDINEEAFLVAPPERIEPFPEEMSLELSFERRGRRRLRRARVQTQVFNHKQWGDGRHAYVVHYLPASPFHDYLIHQYFLMESIIDPKQLCR